MYKKVTFYKDNVFAIFPFDCKYLGINKKINIPLTYAYIFINIITVFKTIRDIGKMQNQQLILSVNYAPADYGRRFYKTRVEKGEEI